MVGMNNKKGEINSLFLCFIRKQYMHNHLLDDVFEIVKQEHCEYNYGTKSGYFTRYILQQGEKTYSISFICDNLEMEYIGGYINGKVDQHLGVALYETTVRDYDKLRYFNDFFTGSLKDVTNRVQAFCYSFYGI
jgi:hypothetical protein